MEAQCSNEVKQYVLMKSDDDIMGPHDVLRLHVGETGEYSLSSYNRNMEESQIVSPIRGVICQK